MTISNNNQTAWGTEESPDNLNPSNGELALLADRLIIPPLKFDTNGTITINIDSLDNQEKLMAREVTEYWAALINHKVVITSAADALITFTSNDDDGASARYTYFDNTLISSTVNVPTDWPNPLDAYVHETGHALGLNHPGPYSGPTFDDGEPLDRHSDKVLANDHYLTSAMSYFTSLLPDGRENLLGPATPMVADILAIQRLYKA